MNSQKQRLNMFCTAPNIEEAEILEGDFVEEDVRLRNLNRMKNSIIKKESEIVGKDIDLKEKVHSSVNKATKLL